MKILKHVLCLVCSLILCLSSFTAFAYSTQYFIDVPLVSQYPKSQWCWAACGASVCQHYGSIVTKEGFSEVVKGDTTNNSTATPSEVAYGLSNWDILTTIVNGVVSYSTIQAEIENANDPIIAGLFKTYEDELYGHMVVIDGFLDDPTEGAVVQYMEPLNVDGTATREYLSYSDFVGNSAYDPQYWVVTILTSY